MDTQDTAAQDKKQEAAPVPKPAAAPAPAPKPAAAPTPAPAPEKQTNCLGCNKPLTKLKRYYRNGKFYCNKKCWHNTVKSKKEEK